MNEKDNSVYLYASMTAQIEVKLRRVSDADVHRCAGRDIAALANLCTSQFIPLIVQH